MSKVGADLVEAFEEMAAYLRGEVEVESYQRSDDLVGKGPTLGPGARLHYVKAQANGRKSQ